MAEQQPPPVTATAPADTDAGPGGDDASPAGQRRLTGTITGHLASQARRTASAAKARRVVSEGGEPGVLDLTPLRQLLSELVDELQQVRLRDRIAHALRQMADVIEHPPKR